MSLHPEPLPVPFGGIGRTVKVSTVLGGIAEKVTGIGSRSRGHGAGIRGRGADLGSLL